MSSGEVMTFPETVEEFMEDYKIVDTEQLYTNGSELVPIFRMKQWFDHDLEKKLANPGQWAYDYGFNYGYQQGWEAAIEDVKDCLKQEIENLGCMI